MASRKYLLKFDPLLVDQPITYRLASDYDLLLNVLRGEVNEYGGELIISLEGEEEAIRKGIDYLEDTGVEVRELTDLVKVDRDSCTDCGMCLSLCPVKAFEIDEESLQLVFHSNACIACGLCVEGCPPGAIARRRE